MAQISFPNIKISRDFHKILEKALDGYLPSKKEATVVLDRSETELSSLLLVAGQIRDQEKGKTLTYSKKVFIP